MTDSSKTSSSRPSTQDPNDESPDPTVTSSGTDDETEYASIRGPLLWLLVPLVLVILYGLTKLS